MSFKLALSSDTQGCAQQRYNRTFFRSNSLWLEVFPDIIRLRGYIRHLFPINFLLKSSPLSYAERRGAHNPVRCLPIPRFHWKPVGRWRAAGVRWAALHLAALYIARLGGPKMESTQPPQKSLDRMRDQPTSNL